MTSVKKVIVEFYNRPNLSHILLPLWSVNIQISVYLKCTNFCVYLFSQAKKTSYFASTYFCECKFLKISWVLIFANGKFLKISSLQICEKPNHISLKEKRIRKRWLNQGTFG